MMLARHRNEATAGVLALLVHVVFVALLVFGVSWQTQHPAPVMVDLWQPIPEPAQPEPPVLQPEPPPAPPRLAPAEVPTPAAPDIALEKRREQAEHRKRAEAARLAEEKALADAARAEEAALRKLRETQLAEQKKREAQKQLEDQELQRHALEEALAAETRQLKQTAARVAASRRTGEINAVVGQYKDLISGKIRGNTRLPDEVKGNPQVKFVVRLMPTGEVLDVRLLQSSGNSAYDTAVERAIRKSSPLPLPEDRDARAQFVPELTLVHRPHE
jgi:colicin import membrane protein